MYRAAPSFAQLKEYLKILVENSLLDCDSVTNKFRTTEKGLRFLQIYNKIGNVMNEQQQQQQQISIERGREVEQRQI